MNKDVTAAAEEYLDNLSLLVKAGHNVYEAPLTNNGKIGVYKKENGGELGAMNQTIASIQASMLVNFGGYESISETWLTHEQALSHGGRLVDSSGRSYIPDKNQGCALFKPLIAKKDEYELTLKELRKFNDPLDDTVTFNEKTNKYEIFYGWSTYRAFNAVEFEGLGNRFKAVEPFVIGRDKQVSHLENIIADNGIKLRHVSQLPMGAAGMYLPHSHTIQMHNVAAYHSKVNYMQVLSHELIHATGGFELANRFTQTNMNDSDFKMREEVLAEMGSGMILSSLGIKAPVESNAAYIQGYTDNLDKMDAKTFLSLASKNGKLIKVLNNNNPTLSKFIKNSPAAIQSATFHARMKTKDPIEAMKYLNLYLGGGRSLIEGHKMVKSSLRHLLKHNEDTLDFNVSKLSGNKDDTLVQRGVKSRADGIKILNECGLITELHDELNKKVEVEYLPSTGMSF